MVLYAQIYQRCNDTTRKWGRTGPASDYRTPAFNRMEPPDPTVLNASNIGFQLAPGPSECSPPLAQSPSSRSMLVCLGDGAVRPVAGKLSAAMWQRICAPADGQALDDDW